MQAKSIDVCQIDTCRVGGVNENLAIILMAAKFNSMLRIFLIFFLFYIMKENEQDQLNSLPLLLY